MYVVDARGLTTDVDAGEASPTRSHPSRGTPTARRRSRASRRRRAASSSRTGTSSGAMDQVFGETSTFYSIASRCRTSRERAAFDQVSVNRRGVSVRTRSSFRAEDGREGLAQPDGTGPPDTRREGRLRRGRHVGLPTSAASAAPVALEARIPLSALTSRSRRPPGGGGRRHRGGRGGQRGALRCDDHPAPRSPSIQAQWEKDKDRFYLFATDARSRPGNLRFVSP